MVFPEPGGERGIIRILTIISKKTTRKGYKEREYSFEA